MIIEEANNDGQASLNDTQNTHPSGFKDIIDYQNAKITEVEDQEFIRSPSFNTLLGAVEGDNLPVSGSKKEIEMTQSLLDAQIEPA